jgi:hypothetical protein
MDVRSEVAAELGAPGKANVLARTPRQREKGLWNFLTWSFFMAQVVAAHQLTVASAIAAEAAQDATASEAAVDPEAVAAAIAALNAFDGMDEQLSGGLALQSTDPGSAKVAAVADVPRHTVDADTTAEISEDGGRTHKSDIAATSQEGSSEIDALTLVVAPDGGVGSVLEPVIDVVDDVLDGVIPPVGGLVGGLVDVLDPVVDGVIAPVAGIAGDLVAALDPVLDGLVTPVAALTETLVGSLEPVLDPLLAPVTGLAGSVIELAEPVLDAVLVPAAGVIEEVLQSLDPVIDPVTGLASSIVAPLGDAVSPVVEAVAEVIAPVVPVVNQLTAPLEDIADTLLSPLAPVVAPLAEPLLGPITSQLSILDGLSGDATEGAGGAQGIGLSQLLDIGVGGGPIVLDGTPAAASGLPVLGGLDDLFSGGKYTEYNLALQGSATLSEGVGASVADSLDALVSNLDVGSLLSVEASEQTASAGGGLSSVLGGGLRFDWL